MRIKSIAGSFASLFLPSKSAHITIGKIALIGMLFTTFFLFTSAYNFPGGAIHYPNWASAIVNGAHLPADHAQREVGFSLLYILSGFTVTHSFIGMTLALAVFATLMSVLVYLCIEKVSPVIGFYMALTCIMSMAPFTYMKFFYPDQAYIFFNLLSVTLLIRYILSEGKVRWLYFFTLAAVMASFTRTAGNLMYPVLLSVAYFSTRGFLRHYLACILIFTLAVAVYQWHRYEIFDMRHHSSTPSGKGMQILYSTYLYLNDFGLRLSPDDGPNNKRLFERMRQELGADVKKSAMIQKRVGATPPDFMRNHFYAYTPEQLIEKVATEPNEEYYWNVIMPVDSNDQFFLDIAKEIMRSHPWYVVQYSMRNFFHALFAPGYATTRYNTKGYIHTGNEFIPEIYGYGSYSEDPVALYGQRAEKELAYFPLKTASGFTRAIFKAAKMTYHVNFLFLTFFTSIMMIVAWSVASMALYAKVFNSKRFLSFIAVKKLNKLAALVFVSSALIVYEDLLTSLFCQPVYRYFHLTEPLRLVVTGFGLVYLYELVPTRFLKKKYSIMQKILGAITDMQKYDVFETYFSQQQVKWFIGLCGLNTCLFVWWALTLLANTA